MIFGTHRRARREAERRSRQAAADVAASRAELTALAASFEGLREELRHEKRARVPGRLAASVFAGATTLGLVAGLAMILHGSEGLGEPASYGLASAGTISVAVAVDGPADASTLSPFEAGTRVGLVTTFVPDRDHAIYEVFFPLEMEGKRFALMLQDGAAFSELGAGVSEAVPSAQCAETGGEGESAFSIPHVCQVIYGTVPSTPRSDDVLSDLVTGQSCEIPELTDQLIRPSVEFEGTLLSPMTAEPDWAHRFVLYPAVLADPPFGTIDQWDGFALDGVFSAVTPAVCKVSGYPFDAKLVDGNPEPTFVTDYALGWTGGAATQATGAMFVERDASASANQLIAVGGLLGGVAFGLLPVAYPPAVAAWREPTRPSGAI